MTFREINFKILVQKPTSVNKASRLDQKMSHNLALKTSH